MIALFKRLTYWITHKELVAVVAALAVVGEAALIEFGDAWPSIVATIVAAMITRANVYSRDSASRLGGEA